MGGVSLNMFSRYKRILHFYKRTLTVLFYTAKTHKAKKKKKKLRLFFPPWSVQYSSAHTGLLVPACLCLLSCETSLYVSIVEKPTGLYPFRDVCSQLNCKVIPVSKSSSKKRYIPGLGPEPRRSPYTPCSRGNTQLLEFCILISMQSKIGGLKGWNIEYSLHTNCARFSSDKVNIPRNKKRQFKSSECFQAIQKDSGKWQLLVAPHFPEQF